MTAIATMLVGVSRLIGPIGDWTHRLAPMSSPLTVLRSAMLSAMPFTMTMEASVAKMELTCSLATARPLMMPTTSAHKSAKTTAPAVPNGSCATIATIPESAKVDPIERSMCPQINTRLRPATTSRLTDAWLSTPRRFTSLRKIGAVRARTTKVITMSG